MIDNLHRPWMTGALILLQLRMETPGSLRNRVGSIDPRRS